MSRGDQYGPIFLSDSDRHSFLKTLAETCQRTGWVILAYVLMDNHYHMLVETPEANLVEGMRWFQSTY
jgi:putative transposase